MTRLRALVFAYACDPEAGSEPAAGWALARAIARFADAVVLTAPEHGRRLQQWSDAHPDDPLTFVVVPEPRWAQLIPRTRIGHFLIYLGWLANARAAALRLDPSSFDLAWHATYAAYWLPTPAATLGIPCVWGPVGGGVTTPLVLWRALGVRGTLDDLWERVIVRAMTWLPQTRRNWRGVSVAIVQNEETLSRLPAQVRERAVVLNHALLIQPGVDIDVPRGPFVVHAASLESRKAPSLVIRALAHADAAVHVRMIGTGAALPALEKLARRLGVRDRVTFVGRLPRHEVLRAWKAAAAGVFTGVREEGGIALAEAMLAGTPVIVLGHGGARTIAEAATDPGRVALIPPTSRDTTVRAIGQAMSRFVLQPCGRRNTLLDPGRGAEQLQTIANRALAAQQHTSLPSSEVIALG